MFSIEELIDKVAFKVVYNACSCAKTKELIVDVYGDPREAVEYCRWIGKETADKKLIHSYNEHEITSYLYRRIKWALFADLTRYNGMNIVKDRDIGGYKHDDCAPIAGIITTNDTGEAVYYVEERGLSNEPDPSEQVERREDLRLLREAIRLLSPYHKRIIEIVLRDPDNSTRAVSEELGISKAAAYSKVKEVYRAIKKIYEKNRA